MASIIQHITILILLTLTFPVAGEKDSGPIKTIDRDSFLPKKENVTHIRLYWHDTVTGRVPSVVTIVPPKNGTIATFGEVRMFDDPLTAGPSSRSKVIGKGQGFYASCAQQDFTELVVMNFVFFHGKYNGSTITIVGRNSVFSRVREMPVIGGSGVFRWARGYVKVKTYNINITSGDAIVGYDIYVMHY